MLGRVRMALGRSASGGGIPREMLPELGKALAPIPAALLVEHFEAEFREVGGTPHRVDSASALRQTLVEILPEGSSVVLSRNPILARVGIVETLKRLNCAAACWPAEIPAAFGRQCFSAAAGITGADFVLAESGTLVLTSKTEGSQLASLAPPIHIALYRREQVVESLEEIFAGLRIGPEPGEQSASSEGSPGRSTVLITGSSRTADIEQISIRGVHGPTQAHAILIEEAYYI